MCCSVFVVCIVCMMVLAVGSLPVQRIPIPEFASHDTNFTTWVSPIHRRAYLLVTTSPWTTVQLPSSLERTSDQARQHHCTFATNAGPYHADGSCVGSVAIQGQWIQTDRGVGWGRTATEYIFGDVDPQQEVGIVDFVTGFDWLVYKGKSAAVNNTTGALRAPRTAMGIDAVGRLMIMVVDGCEWCLRNKGLKVTELADLMIQNGAQYSINLDGGGSSTFVKDGVVVSRPVEGIIPRERPVATILCAHQKRPQLPEIALVDSLAGDENAK